jgi:hypothetical protein
MPAVQAAGAPERRRSKWGAHGLNVGWEDRAVTSARVPARSAFHPVLLRAGIGTLGVGVFLFLAGCYRSMVLLSGGSVKALLPLAVSAPLSGELVILLGVVVIAAAGVLLGAAKRRA